MGEGWASQCHPIPFDISLNVDVAPQQSNRTESLRTDASQAMVHAQPFPLHIVAAPPPSLIRSFPLGAKPWFADSYQVNLINSRNAAGNNTQP